MFTIFIELRIKNFDFQKFIAANMQIYVFNPFSGQRSNERSLTPKNYSVVYNIKNYETLPLGIFSLWRHPTELDACQVCVGSRIFNMGGTLGSKTTDTYLVETNQKNHTGAPRYALHAYTPSCLVSFRNSASKKIKTDFWGHFSLPQNPP